MQSRYIVVLVTAPSQEAGEKIAARLLEKKLAACVNIVPEITSLYTWEGKTQNDQEVLLVIKSKVELFEEHLVPAVLEAHPYEVPEIIALPVLMGSASYLQWIDEVIQA